MGTKIIIAINAFKGCITSREAGKAAARGVCSACPEAEVVVVPVSDGGDGLLDTFLTVTDGRRIGVEAHDPLMNLRESSYATDADQQTAFIEMAAISGLHLLPKALQNPLHTTTYGTGELIRSALDKGIRRFILGLGGSATNDAGLGMLQALGYRFFDGKGNLMPTLCGSMLADVTRIDESDVHPALKEAHFTVACDVRNPFCGCNGAACVFAPQKGANPSEVAQLEAGMQHLAGLIARHTGKEIAETPGAGAAGGMGGALLAFMNAELKSGIQLILTACHFDELIRDADLILTGEGRADSQTLMGKVPYGILQAALPHHIPVVLLAGSIQSADALRQAGFHDVLCINPPHLTLEEAMQPEIARKQIENTAEQICRTLLQ